MTISTFEDTNELAQEVANLLIQQISEHGEICWLGSGGSNIELEVVISKTLPSNVASHIAFSLVDERFGTVGHHDSNWHKLMNSGFESSKFQSTYSILQDQLKSSSEAADEFSKYLHNLRRPIVGLFGIGSDGHTAGILPYSAALEQNSSLATNYTSPDYERITITPHFFERIGLALLVAQGQDKLHEIEQLKHDVDFHVQPAQLLKRTKHFLVYHKNK